MRFLKNKIAQAKDSLNNFTTTSSLNTTNLLQDEPKANPSLSHFFQAESFTGGLVVSNSPKGLFIEVQNSSNAVSLNSEHVQNEEILSTWPSTYYHYDFNRSSQD